MVRTALRMLRFGPRGVGRAVRAAAGTASSVRRSRRGSVLVLILGTLALMSVLAVVYIGITGSDRRTGGALARRESQDRVPEQIRDYAAGIIAEDALDVYPVVGVDAPNRRVDYVLKRETTDYPSTDPSVRSQPAAGQRTVYRFRPTGGHPLFNPFASGLGEDPRVPSDPWLGVSGPTNLTLFGDYVAPQPPGGGSPASAEQLWWFNNRDIMQMSVFSPDGRAVNLYNLRRYGIDARSAVGSTPGSISEGLTLFDDNGDPTNLRIDGVAADPNIPADWFMYQRGAFRAMSDPDRDWSDPEFLFYQYADADGDGMVDSRWTEMVDATDPNSPVSMLATDGRFRYFVAVHAEDLSARVNVNTATDVARRPDAEFPAGFTPSDVSLHRMLTLEDPYADTRDGYALLEVPRDAGGNPIPPNQSPANYSLYDGPEVQVGSMAYDFLQFTRLTGVVPPSWVANDTNDNQLSLFATNEFGLILGANPNLETVLPSAPDAWLFSPEGRSLHFRSDAYGVAGSKYTDPMGGNSNRHLLTHGYGMDSLLDLLSFNHVNDPRTLSPLEATVAGRFAPWPELDPLRSNRGLIEERGDRDRYDAVLGANTPDGVTDYDALAHAAVDVRGSLTTLSSSRPLRTTVVATPTSLQSDPNVFSAMTTREVRVSVPELIRAAASPTDYGWAGDLFRLYADALLPYSAAETAWERLSLVGGSETDTLFYGYRGPEFALRVCAAMVANFADMVEASANDPDDVPTVFTALIDERFRQALDQDNARPVDQRTHPWAWWANSTGNPSLVDGHRLDLVRGPTNQVIAPARHALADSNIASETPRARALNVYGIEKQPFITEVASYAIYTDAPQSAGGDDEWQQAPPPGLPPGFGNSQARVTIDSRVSSTNPDFICEILAVQLTNPFDESIPLGRYIGRPGEPTEIDHAYYLEINGGYYPLAGMVLVENGGVIRYPPPGSNGIPDFDSPGSPRMFPGEITLAPHDSKTFVILSQPLRNIEDRIDEVDGGGTTPGGDEIGQIGRFVKNHFAVSSTLENAVIIERAVSNNVREFPIATSYHPGMQSDPLVREIFDQPVTEVRLWRIMRNSIDASNPGDEDSSNTRFTNVQENDLLVDRLRVPDTHLNRRLALEPLLNESHAVGYKVKNALALTESDTDSKNYNRGLTVITHASVRRPSDPNDPATIGATLPAYCFEPKFQSAGWNRKGTPDPLDDLTELEDSYFDGARINCYREWRDFSQDFIKPGLGGGGQQGNSVRRVAELHEEARDKNKPGENVAVSDNKYGASINDLRVEVGGELDRDAMRPLDLLRPLGVCATYDPFGATLQQQWTTLGEAMAISLGYDRPPPGDLYADAGRLTTQDQTASQGVASLSGPVTRPVLDRGSLVLDDFVAFLDMTPSSPPGRFDPTAGDVLFGEGVPPGMMLLESVRALEGDEGGLERGTPGLINMQTASRRALRSVPMLAPTNNGWWWGQQPHGPISDVASTVIAYRDKVSLLARRGLNPGAPIPVSFSDEDALDAGLDVDEGRRLGTLISGVRERPGFASIGELLAARRIGFASPPGTLAPALRWHNVDRLGYDNGSIDEEGVDSVLHASQNDDRVDDEFDERLAIANAALNSLTVRSDTYAVWFLVHGYQRSDVENLQPTDPMVPTIARRFVMVVDRSSVKRRGDKPKVVLFQEVPL